MIRNIDWKLYNNDKLLVANINKEADYVYNKFLLYKRDNEVNEINFEKKIYKRRTDSYVMTVDFKLKECKFDFNENGNCRFEIDCSMEIVNNKITIKYKTDDDEKKIEIIIRDDL